MSNNLYRYGGWEECAKHPGAETIIGATNTVWRPKQ